MRHIVKATGLSFIIYFAFTLPTFAHDSAAQLPFDRPHAHEVIESHVHLGWESKYFSEGRDALDGDSLFVSSLEMGWKHLSAGVWYGNSQDQRYDELQMSLALNQCFGDFEVYAGYTHFRFPFDDSHDHEIGTGVVWSGLPMEIELSADLYYSFEAEGYFAEISAGREFSITDSLTLNLSTPFGINQGYVSDGHDGANNIALRLGMEYAISESIAFTAHTTYSWSLGREAALPGDAQLVDFFHWGVGFQCSF